MAPLFPERPTATSMSDPTVPAANAALSQLFYVSRSLASPDDVQAILVEARRFNAQAQVTGVLLFSGGHFAQVIEGPAHTIAGLIAAIERDHRHEAVTRLLERTALQRMHAEWCMGYAESPGVDELLQVLLYPPAPIDAGRAERLLMQLFGKVVPT